MQDQSSPAYLAALKPAFPEQLKCPRCESSNTKFCYYNNYNLSQPRHFCKSCRRYWTRGGTLRNVPVGGACRKTQKRPSNTKRPNPDPNPTRNHQARRLDPQNPGSNPGVSAGSFGSILATGDGFGSLLGGFNPDGPGPRAAQLGGFTAELESGSGLDPVRDEQGNGGTDSYLLQGGESSFIGFGWPDLDVYTHG